MALPTDSNRHPSPSTRLTASWAPSEAPSLLAHPYLQGGRLRDVREQPVPRPQHAQARRRVQQGDDGLVGAAQDHAAALPPQPGQQWGHVLAALPQEAVGGRVVARQAVGDPRRQRNVVGHVLTKGDAKMTCSTDSWG